jgi:hypothetical protein
MMAFLHLYLGYSQPLFVQGIMAFKSLYEAKTVKIHILGQATEGDLKRPFKGAGGMFGGACTPSYFHIISFITSTQPLRNRRRTRLPSKRQKNALAPRRRSRRCAAGHAMLDAR